MFWSLGSDSFTTIERPSYGFATSSTENYCVGVNTSNSLPTPASRRTKNDSFYAVGSSGTTPSLTISSFDAGGNGGATFVYNTNNTTGARIYYAAVGGADIVSAKAGTFTLSNATGNQNVTNVGFEPDIVFFAGTDSPAVDSSTADTAHHSWFTGVAKSSSEQNVMAFSSVDNVSTTDTGRYQHTGQCIAFFTSGSTASMDCAAAYVGTTTGGFTINITNAPTSSTSAVIYLAIKGGSWNVGTTNQPTTTGNVSVTGLNHTPKGVIIRGNSQETAFNNAISSQDRWTFGAADSTADNTGTTGQFTLLGGTSDNISATPISWRGNLLTDVIRNTQAGTVGDVKSVARLSSFQAGGFTLNWNTVADTVQRQQLYVTIGDNLGASIVKVAPSETVGITEGVVYRVNRVKVAPTETLNLTETPVKKVGISGQNIIKIASATEFVNFVGSEFEDIDFDISVFTNAYELITITEPSRIASRKRLQPKAETVTVTEGSPVKKLVQSSDYITASLIKVRFSGGAAYNGNAVGGVGSRGGAMSSVEVTDNTLHTAWDAVSAAQASSGITEYRCYYLYNSHSSLTAYDVRMWVDSTTPGGDSIEISRGQSAANVQEQGPLAAENTAPTGANISFSTAPDEDSAISLGDIPPLGYRSFWIKRIVPIGTSSWGDNTYLLRVSFVSNHL